MRRAGWILWHEHWNFFSAAFRSSLSTFWFNYFFKVFGGCILKHELQSKKCVPAPWEDTGLWPVSGHLVNLPVPLAIILTWPVSSLGCLPPGKSPKSQRNKFGFWTLEKEPVGRPLWEIKDRVLKNDWRGLFQEECFDWTVGVIFWNKGMKTTFSSS